MSSDTTGKQGMTLSILFGCIFLSQIETLYVIVFHEYENAEISTPRINRIQFSL